LRDQSGGNGGQDFARPAIAVAVVIGLAAATVAGFWWARRGQSALATTSQHAPKTPVPPVYAIPPDHFGMLAPGSRLPSTSECTALVRPRPFTENKAVNTSFNQATGHALAHDFFDPRSTDPRANSTVGVRVDGDFTGTTHEILRWTACKWGIDEDIVYAQAAKESWWRQSSMGDWHPDASACAPGHGLGADGRPGQCPQSFGILQDRYPFQHSSWPGIERSTAMNADTAYATWRACFEGYERWLNTLDRGREYGAGDAWGCVGRWVSGRWHTVQGEQYAAGVQDYEKRRVWEQRDFVEL
jgi:hypothetical protein